MGLVVERIVNLLLLIGLALGGVQLKQILAFQLAEMVSYFLLKLVMMEIP